MGNRASTSIRQADCEFSCKGRPWAVGVSAVSKHLRSVRTVSANRQDRA